MPHLTLEYTDNIELDVQALLARLHDELVATGAVNLKGLKSRAIRHAEHRVADSHKAYALVHLNVLLRAGRPLEMHQATAGRAMEVLEATCGQRFEQGCLSLSVDIKEMMADVAITKHNIPAGGVNSQAGSSGGPGRGPDH